VPPHYVCTDPSKRDEPRYGKAPNTFKHTRWHETFIPMTGLMTVWADGVPKDLGEGDFAMVPAYHNHTYQFIAQETEFLGLVQPAGFDDFFANVSAPWAPKYNVPFPPDQPLAFPGQKFQAAVKEYDINQISANWTDPVGGHGWHAGNVSLPNDSKTPYFLPNGAGPHYWNEGAGAVISPLATPVQTDGNFTIAHITLRKSQNSLNTTWTSADHQFLYGMRGEVTIFMEDEEVKFISGDSVFIPAGQEVKISSRVNYSKFLLCAAGSNGVDTQMIKAGKVWEYSTPPAH
jgi:quercetin dioxygenase-like cupin family protein